jgi:hypothetical protein
VVVLHGEPGSGKDTIGKRLVDEHGFTRLAFADKLKELCEVLDPVVGVKIDHQLISELNSVHLGERHVDDVAGIQSMRLVETVAKHGWDEAKRRYPEVRRIQRYLATEVVRDHIDADYWVNVVREQIGDGDYVITDLRFPNEDALFRTDFRPDEWSGWWVLREDNPHRVAAAHVSEEWHPTDYTVVHNDGTVDELHSSVDMMVRELMLAATS